LIVTCAVFCELSKAFDSLNHSTESWSS